MPSPSKGPAGAKKVRKKRWRGPQKGKQHPARAVSSASLLAGLNPEQRTAVERTEGPVLVLAGAGTGKTRVITTRIAHLLAQGVPASSILAMTFTNKAAMEMRERVSSLVGSVAAEPLTVGTFHSFCLNSLRDHAEELGWPQGFGICDPSDQQNIIKGALRELHIAEAVLQPQAALSKISRLKNELVTPEEFLKRAGSDQDELVGRAWLRYRESLRNVRRLDFDDLLLEMVGMLSKNEALRDKFRARFRYLLVDEYQDTNGPQYEIVRGLADGHRNLCVVGDDDQSIYGWRGADITKILGFEKDFPGALVVRLETNYRSTREILTMANKLIAHNPKRHDKELRSHFGGGAAVQGVTSRDENAEAEFVVGNISKLVAEKKAKYSDFAILFRTAIQPRPFEAELRMKDVPYVLVGGMSFFDRKEVRDVLAYLRLMVDAGDEPSLLRIVNTPPRGVGKTTLGRVIEYATEKGISANEAFRKHEDIEGVAASTADTVVRLLDRMQALGELARGMELVPAVERLLEEVAYKKEVERIYPDEKTRDQRWLGVMDVLNFAENYVSRVKTKKGPELNGFLNELALTANDRDDGDNSKRDVVTLMTLHASKGLEFPHVYLVGLEEGLLPHARSIEEDTVEEERRLAYVGITRARTHLTLSWTAERAKFGHKLPSHVSRFLYEIKGTPPPADWVAAGAEPAPKKKKKRKTKGRRRKTSRGK
ncbi:MAG: DNA helicase-2/ATP-dependent DNA helicase PcrA [Chlamydiales bacterium]|jgi:DNA helicase-2/ATP-dependent DNA helicase PcrA